MKFCQPHWAALRKAIDDRGLGHLVAKGGDVAAQRMVEQNDGLTLANFEPLMGAHNRILQKALEIGGLGVLADDGCPLETLERMHAEGCRDPNCRDKGIAHPFEHWIDKAADEAKLTYDQLLAEGRRGLPS